jgi:UDP-N-acetylmuramoylalanine--D-glutamate ligase
MRALVAGYGVTGRAALKALVGRGWEVDVIDEAAEAPVLASPARLHHRPGADEMRTLVAAADRVVVSPGIPVTHPIFALAGDKAISEIELGWEWATVPIVAVTGTNGKTTVVTLITEMLQRSGLSALSAGNIGLPLVEAVDENVGVLVVEVSSFQLELTRRFRPQLAVWLNLSEDHLDWHPDMDHYAAAKARIWANQGAQDVTVVNATDEAVMRAVRDPRRGSRARQVSFGGESSDWSVSGEELLAPEGRLLVRTSDMPRALPHDILNGLAAAAAAVEAGADLAACGGVLRAFKGLPHRVTLVAERGGVRYFDDSKATTPASVAAALSGFDSAVLIAGGRNKGLNLGPLSQFVPRLRAVVSIGEAAAEVEAVFTGAVPVERAGSMDEAVLMASRAARAGDAVVLSPGCASYDWYRSYAERGDDFTRAVISLTDNHHSSPPLGENQDTPLAGERDS